MSERVVYGGQASGACPRLSSCRVDEIDRALLRSMPASGTQFDSRAPSIYVRESKASPAQQIIVAL